MAERWRSPLSPRERFQEHACRWADALLLLWFMALAEIAAIVALVWLPALMGADLLAMLLDRKGDRDEAI